MAAPLSIRIRFLTQRISIGRLVARRCFNRLGWQLRNQQISHRNESEWAMDGRRHRFQELHRLNRWKSPTLIGQQASKWPKVAIINNSTFRFSKWRCPFQVATSDVIIQYGHRSKQSAHNSLDWFSQFSFVISLRFSMINFLSFSLFSCSSVGVFLGRGEVTLSFEFLFFSFFFFFYGHFVGRFDCNFHSNLTGQFAAFLILSFFDQFW